MFKQGSIIFHLWYAVICLILFTSLFFQIKTENIFCNKFFYTFEIG